MKRAGLLHTSDCPLERYNSLNRRDQLPFYTDPEEIGRWQDRTLDDSFRLRLLMDAMDHHGLGHPEARYVVGNAIRADKLDKHPLDRLPHDPDIWAIGGVLYDEAAFASDIVPRFAAAGTLDQVPELINAELAKWAPEPFRIVMINASRAARFVRERAVEMEIPEGLDRTPVWGGNG